MSKHYKRRFKSVPQENDSVASDECSYLLNQPRHDLAALDDRISDLERGNRNRRKRKGFARQNTCTSQRPSSLAFKTVSFSPHHVNRGENEASNERNAPAIRTKCAWCEARSKKATMTSPCKKTSQIRNGTDESNKNDSRVAAVATNSPEYYTRAINNHSCTKFRSDVDGAEYKKPYGSDTVKTSNTDVNDPSGFYHNYSKKFGRTYPYYFPTMIMGRNNVGSSITNNNKLEEILRRPCRPISSFRNDDNWEHDSSVNLLLAKYSEYNYPQTASYPTSNSRYKSSFLTQGRPAFKLPNNRSVHVPSMSFNSTLSRAQTMPNNSFADSSFPSRIDTSSLNNVMDRVEPLNYNKNKSLNCAYSNTYQPRDIITPMNDSIFERHFRPGRTAQPCVSSFSATSSEPNIQSKIAKWLQPSREKTSFDFRPNYSLSLPHRSIRFGSARASDADFADDAKPLGRFSDVPMSSLQSRKESVKISRGYSNPPFLRDLPLLSSMTQHVDGEEIAPRKQNPYSSVEKENDYKYSWNRCSSNTSDKPSTHKYSFIENIKVPITSKYFTTKSNSFPIPTAFVTDSNGNYGSRTSYAQLLQLDNSYVPNSRTSSGKMIVDHFRQPEPSQVASAIPTMKGSGSEPHSFTRLNFLSEYANSRLRSRSEPQSEKMTENMRSAMNLNSI